MMLIDDEIARHLDFIVEFKQALLDELEKSGELEDAIRQLQDNGYRGEHLKAGQIVFRYAMDALMKVAIPIFLERLQQEDDMDFVRELAETLTLNWADSFSRGESDTLVN